MLSSVVLAFLPALFLLFLLPLLWLPLLLVILLSLHEWLFQPLLVMSAALFELRPLPWLLLAGLAWLMAGKPGKR